jgi:hypothetical protein
MESSSSVGLAKAGCAMDGWMFQRMDGQFASTGLTMDGLVLWMDWWPNGLK